jgi:GT2 family glycosyltransferase
VNRKLPNPPPCASIIVPTRDRLDLLQPCLESVFRATAYGDYEVIVVDHASVEAETGAYLRRLSSQHRLSVLRLEGSFNFSKLNNTAARQATGDVLVFLNNDTQVLNAEWLKELVVNAIRPEIGAVGAKLFYPDGRIQHGGIELGGPTMARHSYRYFPGDHAGYLHRLHVPHRVDAVTAACMAVAADKFHAVDGFDESAFPVAYNDVDLCLKLERAGYCNLWTPYAQLIHKEQATRGEWRDKREAEAFKRKWATRLAAAPVNPIDA